MFASNFVASHQQVGDFEVKNINGQIIKNGGNVASYFCTPSGQVIHAVVGPVTADRLLKEAKWALDAYSPVRDEPKKVQQEHLSHEHYLAGGYSNSIGHSQEQKIHILLSHRSLASIDDIYDEIFDDILGQPISHAQSRMELAQRELAKAAIRKRPVLYVFHHEMDNAKARNQWAKSLAASPIQKETRRLLRHYKIVWLRYNEMPALSQKLDRPPFESPNGQYPLFVITRSNGEQIASATGWHNHAWLASGLAKGVVDARKDQSPPILTLRRLARDAKKFDSQLAWEIQQKAVTAQQDEIMAMRAAAR